MACTRIDDRVAAAFGFLQDAAAEFVQACDVHYGGVLFALPSLILNGLLRYTATCFRRPRGYYGLETLFLV
ncbi:hypothetical protein JXQ70_02000 [bacterium]|nr:hypothetical protein [bacterium]